MGLKLGSGMWGLICLGLLNRGVGPKPMVPTERVKENVYPVLNKHDSETNIVLSYIFMYMFSIGKCT